MSEMIDQRPDGHESVITMIRRLQQDQSLAKTLSIDDRRRCVEHLTGEGYSVGEISEILVTSERTIQRDRTEIRSANAIQRDPNLVSEIVGQLFTQAELAVSRIRRVTRDKSTAAATKIDGERTCWLIGKELCERLQSLGYLPTAAREIRGEIRGEISIQELPDTAQMQEELARLTLIAGSEIAPELQDLQHTVTRLAVTEQLKQLTSDLEPPPPEPPPPPPESRQGNHHEEHRNGENK